MSFHSLMSSVFSVEKSAVKQLLFLKVLSPLHPTLGTLNTSHFVFGFQQFYNDVFWSHYLFIYLMIYGGLGFVAC